MARGKTRKLHKKQRAGGKYAKTASKARKTLGQRVVGLGPARPTVSVNNLASMFGTLGLNRKKKPPFSRKAALRALNQVKLERKIQKAEEKALEDPVESLGHLAKALDKIAENEKKSEKLVPILRAVLGKHEVDLHLYLDYKEVSDAVQENDDAEDSLEAIADLLESFESARDNAKSEDATEITNLAFDILLELLDAVQRDKARPAAAAPKKNAFSMKSLFNALNEL